MLKLRWLYTGGKSFFTLSNCLEKCPNKLYESLFIQSLLQQFWPETQKKILLWHFLPYCAQASLSIVYFTTMLQERIESESPATWKNLIFITQIGPLLIYHFSKELKQFRLLKTKYFESFWNYVDIFMLTSTSFVIIASSLHFDFISMNSLRVIAALASCATILKMFDWLRLFEQTAFYILLIE